MPIVYRLGDLFCLPSQGPGETWGLAINEAMACKRQVIASNKCGAAIDKLNVQSIFNPYNVDEIMVAIKTSLTSLEIYGLDFGRSNCSLERIAIAIEENL